VPPPMPSQPRPDLNARPPVASQFQPKRHEPQLDQLPPQFRRNPSETVRTGQPPLQRREVLRPTLPKGHEESRTRPAPHGDTKPDAKKAPHSDQPKKVDNP